MSPEERAHRRAFEVAYDRIEHFVRDKAEIIARGREGWALWHYLPPRSVGYYGEEPSPVALSVHDLRVYVPGVGDELARRVAVEDQLREQVTAIHKGVSPE